MARYAALIITVDNVSARSPEHEVAYTLLQAEDQFANFAGMEFSDVPTPQRWKDSRSTSFKWSEISWLRSITRLPIVVKGIQTAEDAWLCAKHGVAGLVVSNHGGYALPDAKGTLTILPEVVNAVGGDVEVYLDGGVRRGTDVLKALAVGARAVFIGRPYIWALISAGEAGVRDALEILRTELDTAMGLCGVTDVREVDRCLISEHGRVDISIDLRTQLQRLSRLHSRGEITAAEYELLNAKLLARDSRSRSD